MKILKEIGEILKCAFPGVEDFFDKADIVKKEDPQKEYYRRKLEEMKAKENSSGGRNL